LPERLTGKTVLVVGADGNLGPLWVEAALAEGASVLGIGLNALTDPALARLATTYSGLSVANVDITDHVTLEALETALDLMAKDLTIDGVILNAGIDSLPGSGRENLEDYDIAEWQRVFSVNVFGVVGVLNTVIPVLGNPSSVVMLGSLYGLVSPKPALYSHFNEGKGSVKHPAYGASKAALVAVAKQYGTHLAPRGVRVNTLTLGGVAAGQDPDFVAKFEAHVPQSTMLSRDDLTGAMTFLLSDESRAMTGQNVIVDGGFTAW
jgi:NAD(P)-dependent dehydrogenase (short-subunit alcohol dehydrogenase family)